jgi:hypothetical protein
MNCTTFPDVTPTGLVEASFLLVACLAYSSTLKMKVVLPSEAVHGAS